jgi:hypothetical protein
MKTYQKTVRVGEWLGPVSPDYNFNQHSWTGSHGGANPKCVEQGQITILQMNKGEWEYRPSDWYWYKIIHVGMYDGWPYWKPTPAIGYIGPLNSVEIAFFYNLDKRNTRRCDVERLSI